MKEVLSNMSPVGAIIDGGGTTDADETFHIDMTAIPILPLRGIVPFQFISMPLPIGRPSSLEVCELSVANRSPLLAVAQTDPAHENPLTAELYSVGVVCRVLKVLQMPDGTHTAFLLAGPRARILESFNDSKYRKARIELLPDSVPVSPDDENTGALIASVIEKFEDILDMVGPDNTNELRFTLDQMDTPLKEINFISANAPIDFTEKQKMLEITDFNERITQLILHLNRAFELMKIKRQIAEQTHVNLSQQQKEQFLQQQIRTIQEELGGAEDEDMSNLKMRAGGKVWSEAAAKHFNKELKKLERYNPQNPEYSIQYAYLDNLLNLPWEHYTEEKFSLDKVEKILDRDHYGLEKVKDRILEHMSVIKLRGDLKAPILCLFGPPGVGKTSLGKSIADSLGREYARISLGGLHDEAEIRGHRRTYIGAMPGRIITALSKCGTGNPVIVLDEIDKIGKDFKGDPSTALLEVLDPEQNMRFHDNYIDFDYDLSKVLFIATANSLSTISAPLLDRMEVIDISGYITEEKVEIAKRHLIPKELENNGFDKKEITFTKQALVEIIEKYTRETGVRQLEKTIGKVLRKIARLKASGKPFQTKVVPELLKTYLGKEMVTPDMYETNDNIGVVTGLAWTSVGGEILFIESSLSKGKGNLTLTGNLGNVMKESATLALQYIRAHASDLGIDSERFAETDVHVHVPEGAVPKDGPSAGVTMVTSLVSSFTERKVRSRIAMTGEITLRGKVLPVGGIKEKILAAKRAGITDIMLSSDNRKDIEEINDKYIKGLTFHYVDKISDVLDYALL